MDHFSISHTCRGHLLVPHCNTIVKSRRELQPTAGDTPKYVLHRSVVQHMVLMGRCDISRAPSVIVDSLAGGELLHGWFMHLLNCAELVEGSYVIVAWGLRHFLFKMTYSSLSVLWARFIAAQPLAEAAPGLDCHYDIISTQEVCSFLTRHIHRCTWGVTSRHQDLWLTHTPGKEVLRTVSILFVLAYQWTTIIWKWKRYMISQKFGQTYLYFSE